MNFIKAILPELIRWGLSVSWLFFATPTPNDLWVNNSMKTSLLTIASITTYMLLTGLYNAVKVKRPICVFVEFKNLITEDVVTNYFDKNESTVKQRTVQMTVNIKKRDSLFTSIALKFLASEDFWINVEPLVQGDFVLQFDPNLILEKQIYGLKINLGSLLKQMLTYDQAEVKEEIDLKIFKSRDAGISGNRSVDIVSKELVNDSRMNIFHKLLYKIELGSHKIRYFTK